MKTKCYSINDLSADVTSPLTGCSFFASHGFIDLWTKMGGHGVFWTLENNGEILALLPGVEFGKKGLKRFQAMPDGCYGTVLTSNKNIKEHAGLILDGIASAGYHKIYIYDYHNVLPLVVPYQTEICQTHLIDLNDENWLPPDKKLQSEIRKAQREQVEIVRFSFDRHFDKFIKLMKKTEQRHGRTPKYKISFFEALAKLAENDDRICWYWCERDNQAVTSHINFTEKTMALHWQVYFDKSFSFLKANQIMLVKAVRELTSQGVKLFNLGASPTDAAGLLKYKEKYGTREYSYPCLVYKSLLGKLV